MIVAGVHARGSDPFDFLVQQLGSLKPAAQAFEFLQLLIFVRRDEVAGERTITRNGNRLTLRQHFIATEVAGELGGRNGISHIHASSLSPPNYTLFT